MAISTRMTHFRHRADKKREVTRILRLLQPLWRRLKCRRSADFRDLPTLSSEPMLHWFETSSPQEGRPFLHLSSEKSSKLLGRRYLWLEAQLRQYCIHFGRFQALVNFGIELIDDGGRHSGRTQKTYPAIGVKPNLRESAFYHGRYVRQE